MKRTDNNEDEDSFRSIASAAKPIFTKLLGPHSEADAVTEENSKTRRADDGCDTQAQSDSEIVHGAGLIVLENWRAVLSCARNTAQTGWAEKATGNERRFARKRN